MDIIAASENLGINQNWFYKLDGGDTFIYYIGQDIKDIDNSICKIIDKTPNSINVFIKKKVNKDPEIQGIDCTQWFTVADFIKRFKI
jgi:hypothetical protein